MAVTYRTPRPNLNVNCVVVRWNGTDEIKYLVVQRRQSPFRNSWALLGNTVAIDETFEQTVIRSMNEQTGIKAFSTRQFRTFDQVDRDPRERVISTVYYVFVPFEIELSQSVSDARRREWFSISSLPRMAFDHAAIIEQAHIELERTVHEEPLVFSLLPPRFTLTTCQSLYESILGEKMDKRNFRKNLLAMNILVETGSEEVDVKHRPSKLFRFDKRKYRAMIRTGQCFAI